MPRYTMQDGEQLYVREMGQGHPVLVLSGLGMQSWQWLPFIATHLKTFKFIIPDWRGFGGSGQCGIPANDAISSHWQDIECLIKQLDLNDFILMGYSMGATTAMHGMQYGDLGIKLKAYLHIDQTPKISTDDTWAYGLLGAKYPEFKVLMQHLAKFLHGHQNHTQLRDLNPDQRNQLVELWMAFLALQSGSPFTTKVLKFALSQPSLQQRLLPIQRLDYMRWYIDNYLHHDEDYRKALSKLDCPATFFIGTQSTLYPAQGQIQIAESVANSNHVLFKRSGHAPLITEPFKFSAELSKFLKRSAKD